MVDQSVMPSFDNDASGVLKSFRKTNVYKEITYTPQNIFEIERVKDWSKRIEAYDERQKGKYQLAFKKMEQLKVALYDKCPEWKTTIDNKKDKLICE